MVRRHFVDSLADQAIHLVGEDREDAWGAAVGSQGGVVVAEADGQSDLFGQAPVVSEFGANHGVVDPYRLILGLSEAALGYSNGLLEHVDVVRDVHHDQRDGAIAEQPAGLGIVGI